MIIAVFENIAWEYMLLQSMKDRNHSNVNPANLGLLVKPMFKNMLKSSIKERSNHKTYFAPSILF